MAWYGHTLSDSGGNTYLMGASDNETRNALTNTVAEAVAYLADDGTLTATKSAYNAGTNSYTGGSAVIGSGSDIVTINTNGVLLGGTATVYDDLAPFPILVLGAGSSAATLRTVAGSIKAYTFDQTDDAVQLSTEVTHKAKDGADIELHMHWMTQATSTVNQYVAYQLDVAASKKDENLLGPYTFTGRYEIPANSGTRQGFISTLGTLSGTLNLNLGTYLLMSFKRVAATGSEASGATVDPFVIAIGSHAEMDTIGSSGMYTK